MICTRKILSLKFGRAGTNCGPNLRASTISLSDPCSCQPLCSVLEVGGVTIARAYIMAHTVKCCQHLDCHFSVNDPFSNEPVHINGIVDEIVDGHWKKVMDKLAIFVTK